MEWFPPPLRATASVHGRLDCSPAWKARVARCPPINQPTGSPPPQEPL